MKTIDSSSRETARCGITFQTPRRIKILYFTSIRFVLNIFFDVCLQTWDGIPDPDLEIVEDSIVEHHEQGGTTYHTELHINPSPSLNPEHVPLTQDPIQSYFNYLYFAMFLSFY